jgi:putative transposase
VQGLVTMVVCLRDAARILFDSIEQVQQTAARWLWTYNHERPNMALGGITPMQKLALAA